MHPKLRTNLLAGLAGTLLSASTAAQGAPPQLLHLQARLTDAGGAPLAGPVTLRIAVYDAAVGGSQLWLEAESTTALNGVVSLLLGDSSALPASLFAATDRWLALQVGADPEMTPRLRIASEPYALRAGSVAALDASTVIPPGTITSAHIADGAVSSFDLAGNSVTTAKIADSAVTMTKIVASAVGGAAIAAGAVDGTKIADGSITNADVSGAAGIAGTKVAPNFGSQTLVTLGSAGIGTGAPTAKLEVQQSGSATGILGESATGYGVVGQAHAAGGGAPLFLPIAGVEGFNDATNGVGVWGWATAAGGKGIRGDVWGTSGDGVYGRTAASTGAVVGVRGESNSTSGTGVLGEALSTSGLAYGVFGRGHSSAGYAGYFENTDGFALRSVGTTGVLGEATSVSGDGVVGRANATSGPAWGVRGESYSSSGVGVRGEAIATSGANFGVYGQANSAGGYAGYFRNTALGVGAYVEGRAKGAGSGALRVHNPETAQAQAGYFTNASDYHTLVLENTGTGGTLWMKNAGSGTYITAIDENGQWDFWVDKNGKTSTRVLQILGGSDLSEGFDVAPAAGAPAETLPEPGLVVSIDPENPGKLAVSRGAYDRTVAGVISGAGGVQPGMIMGQEGSVADGEHPVALTGRVYVRCDASAEPIRPGDLLTTSDVPGHAMRAADRERAAGAILGKAMSALDQGRGLVLVLVSLQ